MVNESISGFKKDGSWEEVVEHGENITDVLEEEEVGGDDFDDWDDWRPKTRENIGNDMTDKTAEQISADAADDTGVKVVAKKAFGTFEKTIYSKVMGRAGPLYFDNDLISAKLERKKGLLKRGDEGFALEVDIHDLNLKEKVRKALG